MEKIRTEHLRSDKHEDDRETVLEIVERLHRSGKNKIDRSQPENGEHIGRVDEERVSRYAEHCRNGINGEYDIRCLHGDKNNEHRCDAESPFFPNEEPGRLGW